MLFGRICVISMEQKIEKVLKIISDTEKIPSEDLLSSLLKRKESDEIDESELFLVSAAGVPDYERFLRRVEEQK